MSGTSIDAVDAAIIETDGEVVKTVGGFITVAYDEGIKNRLIQSIEKKSVIDVGIEKDITIAHVQAVEKLLAQENKNSSEIDLIGFHGQTIFHDPDNGFTNQIGDGELLAKLTSIDVVNDFRSNDVANGGQGAPLIPIFHQAIFNNHEKPISIINVGGVANVSYLGKNSELIAFDTGPGNALIDDIVRIHKVGEYDEDGNLAAKGEINQEILADLIDNPFFERPVPKSLDRNEFSEAVKKVEGLSLEDACATLTAFTAVTIIMADKHFPEKPIMSYITGGGSKNKFLMSCLHKLLDGKVKVIEEAKSENIEYFGDAIEAQGFAFLAVRSIYNLPLSLPSTTGVKEPMVGGKLHKKVNNLQN